MRKTINWFLLFVLVAGGAGGGYAWWVWANANRLLLEKVRQKLAEIAPNWDIRVGSARFDWHRRVHLYNVTLQTPGGEVPLLAVPEAVLEIERERLQQRDEVLVQTVTLLRPRLLVVRDAAGRWNWQNLPPPPRRDHAAADPEWRIEGATIRVEVERDTGRAPAAVELQETDARLVPDGRRCYLAEAEATLPDSGRLTAGGRCDFNLGRWSLDGKLENVPTHGALVDLVAEAAAGLQQKGSGVFFVPSEHMKGSEPGGGHEKDPRPLSALGVSGTLDMSILLGRSDRSSDVGLEAHVALKQGTLDNPLLPFPLFEVQADADVTPRGVEIRRFTGRNGLTEVTLDGRLTRQNGRAAGKVHLDVKALPLDERLRRRLPDSWRRIYDQLAPGGSIDVNGALVAGAEGGIRPEGFVLTARGCSMRHVKFPYPVQGISGRVVQSGRRWNLWFTGRTGQRQGWCGGYVENPGPAARMQLEFLVHRLPIDETLLEACAPPVRRTLRSLRLAGRANAYYRLERPAGEGRGIDYRIVARVGDEPIGETLLAECSADFRRSLQSLDLLSEGRVPGVAGRGSRIEDRADDHSPLTTHHSPTWPSTLGPRPSTGRGASLNYEHFPYSLTDATGTVRFSSKTGVWTFSDVVARHAGATIRGRGSFSQRGRNELSLTIEGDDVRLDQQLRQALPMSLQQLWHELEPSGRADLTADIRWTPGRPVEVALPEIEVFDGGLTLKAFPWPMDGIRASLDYAEDVVRIRSFRCRHNDTQVQARGFAVTGPDGWRVRLTELFVDDLVPHRLFRRTLPGELRAVVEELDPQGALSLSGMAEIRGTGRRPDRRASASTTAFRGRRVGLGRPTYSPGGSQWPITAAWDLKVVFSGNSLAAGVDLEDVYGSVRLRGSWDGRRIVMKEGNRVDLDSARVWDYQLTQVRGPLELDGSLLTIGSREMLKRTRGSSEPAGARAVPLEERLTARFVGGLVTLDGLVQLKDEPEFVIKATLNHADLDRYARRYISDARNLRGVMNGWIELAGRGSPQKDIVGRGQLQISPAALYELPVLVQVFTALSLTPTDGTAFTYALADFDVKDSRFNFHTIDLVGDALNLRGRGYVGFDGRLALDFYSMLPRSRWPVPLVRELARTPLVRTATSGWVKVEARGRTNDPRTSTRLIPQLDTALRGFLGAFDPRGPAQLPRLLIEPLGPLQLAPLLRPLQPWPSPPRSATRR